MGTLNSWDVIDASNNLAPPDGWPENTMNYSDVNNTGRAVQGTVKRFFADINGSLDAAGAADAYTLTLNETGYTAYFDGMMFSCTIPVTNLTTTPTIDVNGIGAATVTDRNGNPIGVGELMSGGVYDFRHDGTNLRVIGGQGVAGATGEFQYNMGGAQAGAPGLTYDSGSDEATAVNPLNITNDIAFFEQADHVSTVMGGRGYLWVRDDDPCVLVFTNDNGVDTLLGTTGSTPPGGPTNAVQYNNAGNLGGDAAFSLDPAATSGPIVAINEVASATSAQVLQLLVNDASGIGELLQIQQDDNANGATLLQLSQSGTDGFSLEISHTGNEPAISLFSDNTTEPAVVFEHDGAEAALSLAGGGNGPALLLSGRSSNPGIQFPGTPIYANEANTLDHYEWGYYETEFVVGGGGSSGTVTINGGVDTLAYIRIGRFVWVMGYLQIGSVSSPVGDLRVLVPYNTTLATPNFANQSVTTWYTTGFTGGSGVSAGHHPMVIGGNDNYIELQIVGDSSIADRTASGNNLWLNFCYITEDVTLNP